MRNILLGSFLAAICFIFSGCLFDAPMATAPSGSVDPALIGKWRDTSGDDLIVSQTGMNTYRIVWDKAVFTAFQADIDGVRFINTYNGKNHNFLTYTLEDNGMTLRVKAVGVGLISASEKSTERIQSIIKANLRNPKLYDEDGKSEILVFKRIGAPASTSNPVSASKPAATADLDKPASSVTGSLFLSKDAKIYYETRGPSSGDTPIVFIHGGPGFDHQYFLSNSAIVELAKNRPLIFYDQRGTGKSEKVSGERKATLENGIEDLENLRRQLGYEKIAVAGHSFGGLVAMTYAVLFPDKVSHLILIDSVPANYDEEYDTFAKDYPNEYQEMRSKRIEYLMGNRDPKALRASVVAYMKMLFRSTANRDRFIAGSEQYSYDVAVNSSVNSSAEGFNITPGIAKLSIPTLILHGKYDSNITVESSEKIQKTIPGSRLVIFEQSGHMPFYEEPQKFVTTVQNFLDR